MCIWKMIYVSKYDGTLIYMYRNTFYGLNANFTENILRTLLVRARQVPQLNTCIYRLIPHTLHLLL